MLKEYLKERKISIYSLSKQTAIPYSTLNDISNGKVEIDNCKIHLLVKLSKALDLSFEDLYDICLKKDNEIYLKQYDKKATIKVKNKRYYVEYFDDNEKEVIDLFKVNCTNSKYVKDAAEWLVEDKMIDKEMENYVIQFNEKK